MLVALPRRLSTFPVAFLAAFALLHNVVVVADVAEYNTQPKGTNPTLYDAGVDPIVQLDATTFNDTIFCSERGAACNSYIVEFYSDWCGHCRAYAPLYKALALDTRAWQSVVKVAAINCADAFNDATCKANGVAFYPFIKYFPRNSTDESFSIQLKPYDSLARMRDEITQVLVEDYAINHFADWPNLDNLGNIANIDELWEGARPSADAVAVVFDAEANSLVGAQLLLDLSQFAEHIVARRSIRAHPLVHLLHITDFPTLVIFRRGETTPALVTELRRLLLSEIEYYMKRETSSARGKTFGSHKNQSEASAAAVVAANCAENADECKKRYFVSESDMLKAMRYALISEVTRSSAPIAGANLTALRNFVELLSEHFPHNTVDRSEAEVTSVDEGQLLDASSRARAVFAHLLKYLDSRASDEPLTVDEWQNEFNKSEEEQNRPFPTGADWEHCRGSSPHFRGYTCGLWTTFHALTVSAYKNSRGEEDFRPVPVLYAIRDWVGSFFGCEHCRNHFLKMTTRTAKIETRVLRNEDVFLYLWKAHNMVNARLQNRETEDPHFPKFQFPAPFLCPECRQESNSTTSSENERNFAEFDKPTVQNYLIKYYSSIKPISSA